MVDGRPALTPVAPPGGRVVLAPVRSFAWLAFVFPLVLLLFLLILGLSGCAKSTDDAAGGGSAASDGRAVMPPAEVKLSRDACNDYVARACACAKTVPGAKAACDGSHALPDAIRVALEVAASPDSSPSEAKQSQSFVRKTVKECIEQTAKLPALGCP